MKIKNIFGFSSQKAAKNSENHFTNINVVPPPPQVSTNNNNNSSRDIHSEYCVNEMLGKGGFGRVFNAIRKSDGLEVAVKEVVKDSRYKSDNINNNFPAEISLMQQVQNVDGVIKILDCFDTPDCYYIVMEKFDSKDLFDFITEQGPLSEKLGKTMFREIVSTVIQCRDSGVLHRDIKDENILVDLNTMKTKLIDFGSGCFYNHQTQRKKIFEEFRGTRVYSPPEWIQLGEYTGDGLTVWSLGILLYDILCGDIPYTTDREISSGKLIFHNHVKLSAEAKDLIKQCLSVLPHQRISLDKILSHPWLRDGSSSSKLKLSPSFSLKPSSSSSSLMSTSPALSSLSSSPNVSSSVESAESILTDNLLLPTPSSSSLLVMSV